jgi:hypothetical protein
VPLLPKLVSDFAIVRWRTRNSAVASSLVLCSEEQEGGGGRNARATSRALRILEVPPAIPSRESPVTADSARNHLAESETFTFFAEHTLHHIVAPCNTKRSRLCGEPVDDETSLWKPEEI